MVKGTTKSLTLQADICYEYPQMELRQTSFCLGEATGEYGSVLSGLNKSARRILQPFPLLENGGQFSVTVKWSELVCKGGVCEDVPLG